jgi:hypothetical protein
VKDDFAKLLRSVDPGATCGFGFEGVILKPGSVVTRAQLRPTLEFPAAPVLLEMARVPEDAPAAQRHYEDLVVLWRWEREAWCELGRARSKSWEWAIEVRAIAVRAIEEQRVQVRVAVSPEETQRRIVAAIERELAMTTERARVLAIVHDQLASRMAGVGIPPIAFLLANKPCENILSSVEQEHSNTPTQEAESETVTTSVTLPKQLWRRVRASAGLHGITAQQLCAEGLEMRLKQLEASNA